MLEGQRVHAAEDRPGAEAVRRDARASSTRWAISKRSAKPTIVLARWVPSIRTSVGEALTVTWLVTTL